MLDEWQATDDPPQMNPIAYIETSVVSHLAARPSRDVVVAAYQEVTREWWRARIERACREAGYEPPVICTPNELMETGHGDDPA